VHPIANIVRLNPRTIPPLFCGKNSPPDIEGVDAQRRGGRFRIDTVRSDHSALRAPLLFQEGSLLTRFEFFRKLLF